MDQCHRRQSTHQDKGKDGCENLDLVAPAEVVLQQTRSNRNQFEPLHISDLLPTVSRSSSPLSTIMLRVQDSLI